MDSLTIAVAAGVSLGILIGYRGSRALIRTAGEPYASSPLLIGLAVAGAVGFMIPAVIFSLLISRNIAANPHETVTNMVLAGVVAGNAIVIGSGLVVGAVAGALCAKLIEHWREGMGR
ncbi:MAG: hypothetical protein L6Q83_04000 [Gammaproteobacteria bacterium]|jgi:predicted branched-subunit amino acid permease|nr:hypothetical protein [Gammaproteobacteria bacterium]